MTVFLSLRCFTVFFFMKLLIRCLERFSLEMEGGQMVKSTYAMGGGS